MFSFWTPKFCCPLLSGNCEFSCYNEVGKDTVLKVTSTQMVVKGKRVDEPPITLQNTSTCAGVAWAVGPERQKACGK